MFRTDRWQLFTLWTYRQLNVELSCVAINGPLEALSDDALYKYTLTLRLLYIQLSEVSCCVSCWDNSCDVCAVTWAEWSAATDMVPVLEASGSTTFSVWATRRIWASAGTTAGVYTTVLTMRTCPYPVIMSHRRRPSVGLPLPCLLPASFPHWALLLRLVTVYN